MEKKYKVVIVGAGESARVVLKCINQEKAEVLYYCDNNIDKQKHQFEGKYVKSLDVIGTDDVDFYIIATVHSEKLLWQIQMKGIEKSKIIDFFYENSSRKEELETIFDLDAWFTQKEIQLLKVQVSQIKQQYEDVVLGFQQWKDNIKYELVSELNSASLCLPQIKSSEEAIERIVKDGCSIARFGDYEFELIFGRDRAKYQCVDRELSVRLKEVLQARKPGLLIGIANNYGSLERYTEEAQRGIRSYLTPKVRQEHYAVLDIDYEYYDAYMTRPYMIYKDRENADKRFRNLKRIWEGKNILLVEGMQTRMGVGNDLFSNALSVRRILGPAENAFSKYSQILKSICENSVHDMILISLGPTATILTYDLYKLGLQAIDIGHIDNEYEWFLRKTEKRALLKGKYVNEVYGGNIVEDIGDKTYYSQIIRRIVD